MSSAAQAVRLAKLSRPRLHAAVARQRLFSKLTEARHRRSAICVFGPPGAGKTTLIASWLDALDIGGIWYQVDPIDTDVATFFYYLREAVKAFTRKGQRPLPLLTPEFQNDAEGFARRFFREFFARLPEGATFVLDNYQEVAPDQLFHQLAALAVEEAPPEVTIIVLSRNDLPDCYARLIANERVSFLDWDDLKFTLEEARAVGAGRAELGERQLEQIHNQSSGWAAGLTFLMDSVRRDGELAGVKAPESLRDVFNYFAGQLFNKATPKTQTALLQLSFLPRMNAKLADQLTGEGVGSRLLEDLHRRHLFIDRRIAETSVYQFHALLRAFLQHLAEKMLPATTRTHIAMQAAEMMERSGEPEDAVPLYLQAHNQEAVIRIILAESAGLIGQGRWRVVVDWIQSLPLEVVESDCWLLHWLGTALVGVDPRQARSTLERSFALSVPASDDLCQLQAAAGIIQTYLLEYTKFRPMDRWIEVLRSKLGDGAIFPDEDAELRAQSALFIALMYRRPDDVRAPDCARATFRLLSSEAGVNLRTTSAAYLSAYGGWTGLDIARRAIPILTELLSHPEVTASAAGWALFAIAFCHMVDCKEKESREALEALKRLGVGHGMPAMVRLAAVIGTHLELGAGRVLVAREWTDVLKKVMTPGHPYDEASLEGLTAWVAAHDGDAEAAEGPIGRAVSLYDEAGTHIHQCFSRVQHAVICTLLGKMTEAERWVSEALDFAKAMPNTWVEVEARIAASLLALESNRVSTAHENLRCAFGIARQRGYIWPFKWLRRWVPRLCEEALNAEIEVEYVHKVIRELGLVPASVRPQAWPWPIKIYTLGEFRLLLDDQPLRFGRKAPRRLLRALKALVALGGREVPMERLADALWTDAEADLGLEACEKAVSRLRSLLKFREAIQIEDGKVSLNDALVWIDSRALEEVLAHLDSNGDPLAPVLALYRGEFLADELDAPWASPIRESLRGKFIHRVEQAGRALESADRRDEAIAAYLRGLDADALSEAFYCGLMRCYAALGDRAEALSVYRRMRQQLSVVLGIQPSPRSEGIARELGL